MLLTWLTGATARGSGSPRPVDGGGEGRGMWRPQKLKLRRSSDDTAADEVCGTWRRCARNRGVAWRARRLGRGGRVLRTVEGNDNAGVVAIGTHEAANLCCDWEAVAHHAEQVCLGEKSPSSTDVPSRWRRGCACSAHARPVRLRRRACGAHSRPR